MGKVGGLRRNGLDDFDSPTAQVPGCGDQVAAKRGTKLVRPPLFGDRNFRHGRRDDMREQGAFTRLRRNTGERPGAALVIHDAARAIDRVDDAFPIRGRCCRALRKAKFVLDAFHHDLDRKFGGPVDPKPSNDCRFTDLVYRVDGVAAEMACDHGEVRHIQMLAP